MKGEGKSLSLHFYQLKGYLNLPYHIGIVLEELAFDDAVSYTWQGNRLQQN